MLTSTKRTVFTGFIQGLGREGNILQRHFYGARGLVSRRWLTKCIAVGCMAAIALKLDANRQPANNWGVRNVISLIQNV